MTAPRPRAGRGAIAPHDRSRRREPARRAARADAPARVAIAEPPPLGRSASLLVLLALVVFSAVEFAPQVAGKVFVLGDATAYRPFSDFSHARWVEHHERTFWNPYVFLGIAAAPSLADARPQWLPDLLLSAWDGVTRSPSVPPLWPALLVHGCGVLAAAWLARRVWGSGPWSMVLAGVAWGFAAIVTIPLAYGHDAQFLAMGLIPPVLYGIERLCAAPATSTAVQIAVGVSMLGALQVLAGHPQFAAYSVLLAAVFALVRARAHERPQRAWLCAAAGVFGLALSAAVWWPALEYGGLSVRAGQDFAIHEGGAFSAGTLDLLATLWPGAAGFGGSTYHGGMRATDFPNYMGVIVVVAALAGAMWNRGSVARRERGTVLLCAALIVAGLILALGTHLPVAGKLIARSPGFSLLRTPINSLLLTQLAVVLLAARGFDFAWQAGSRIAPRIRPVVAAGVILLAALDLGRVAVPQLRRATGPRAAFAVPPRSALARAGDADSLHRVFPMDPGTYFSNAWVAWRVRSVAGLHGAVPGRWDDLRTTGLLARNGFVRGLAVRYLAGSGLAVDSTQFDVRDGVLVVRNPLPRAYGVAQVATPATEREAVSAMLDPRFDPTRLAFVSAPEARGEYPGSERLEIRWLLDHPDDQRLEVTALAPSFLVVADSWFPGWAAALDGAAVTLHRTNHALRGVVVPAGRHELRMTYRPVGWSASVAVTRTAWCLAIAMWLAAGVASVRARRAAPAAPVPLAGI